MKKLYEEEDIRGIAEAIREKNGTTTQYKVSEMKPAILAIPSGASEPYIEETYDENGNLIDVNLVGYTAIRPYAFYNCTRLALTSLPSGITSIGSNAFYNCTSLALTSLPSGLTSIGSNAFNGCTGLTSITFQGKPNSIASNAFRNCTNLKTINVPWASGELSGAPWGATNATINYNYTG